MNESEDTSVMSTRKTPEERLQNIEQKMEQMKAKKQQLQAAISQKERKARTRRLIQIGAIFETHFELESTAEAEYVARELKNQAKSLLSKEKEDTNHGP